MDNNTFFNKRKVFRTPVHCLKYLTLLRALLKIRAMSYKIIVYESETGLYLGCLSPGKQGI